MDDLVLDGHAHCGVTVPFEEIAYEWQTGGIHGGVIFSPVEEIYDRYDPSFKDSQGYRHSRSRVHRVPPGNRFARKYFSVLLCMERFFAHSG